MIKPSLIIIHLILFEGMFVVKNIFLMKKIRMQIYGKNKEAKAGIVFFTLFIFSAIALSVFKSPIGEIQLLESFHAIIIGVLFLLLSIILGLTALVNLKDSWRVGVLEDQKTELVSSGIYRFTRNPYFLSSLFMLIGYTVILQNIILLGLSVLGFLIVHKMILKEEEYLYSIHGSVYEEYKKKVPRYLLI